MGAFHLISPLCQLFLVITYSRHENLSPRDEKELTNRG